MAKIYRKQLISGESVSCIIHNGGSYFLTNLSVYADGVIDCWEHVDLDGFQKKLECNWVVTNIPSGKCLSVSNVGNFKVSDAKWLYNKDTYYEHILDVIRSFDPDMTNIYRTPKALAHDNFKPCGGAENFKFYGKYLREFHEGESCYIFYNDNGKTNLTLLTAYADKTFSIEAAGEHYYTPEQIFEMLDNMTLDKTLYENTWVHIDGLGELLLEQSPKEYKIDEIKKEIKEMLLRTAGEQTDFDKCVDAYHYYLTHPDKWARENLKKAYEALPESRRMYLGDMDDRDSDYIRIIYHSESKREV